MWHHFATRGLIRETDCIINGPAAGWCWGAFNRSAPQPRAVDLCGSATTRRTPHGVLKANVFRWRGPETGALPGPRSTSSFRRSFGREGHVHVHVHVHVR